MMIPEFSTPALPVMKTDAALPCASISPPASTVTPLLKVTDGSVTVESTSTAPATSAVPMMLRELATVGSLLLTTATVAPWPTVRFWTDSVSSMMAGTAEVSCALTVGPGTLGLQFCGAFQGSPEAELPEAGSQTTVAVTSEGDGVEGIVICCVGVTVIATFTTSLLLVGTGTVWVRGGGLFGLVPPGLVLPLS